MLEAAIPEAIIAAACGHRPARASICQQSRNSLTSAKHKLIQLAMRCRTFKQETAVRFGSWGNGSPPPLLGAIPCPTRCPGSPGGGGMVRLTLEDDDAISGRDNLDDSESLYHTRRYTVMTIISSMPVGSFCEKRSICRFADPRCLL